MPQRGQYGSTRCPRYSRSRWCSRCEQPPDRLDVVVAAGDVGMLVVEPVRDPVGELSPIRSGSLKTLCARAGVELRHAEPLDLLLPVELELLLDLDLDRQAVGVPARDAGDLLALHRVVAADQVLDRAGEDVMDARTAVGRGRALVEHERLAAAVGLEGPPEQALGLPALRAAAAPAGRRRDRARTGTPSGQLAPPASATSRVSCGSARPAVAMIRPMSAGSSASGRHWSVMIEMPMTRMPSCTATITSGTVDMPTTSAPIARSIRYSARVSRLGPVTATYTPSRSMMPSSSAAFRASARSSGSYGADMSGKRGPRRSSLGPTSGLSPSRLM